MTRSGPDTDELLERVNSGDDAARQRLLARHRTRLKRMIAVRIDRRLAARIDPSDVVQEALTEADRRLADFLKRRPMAFHPWLRQIAWERLLQLHRHHIASRRRSVKREQAGEPGLPDESLGRLADRLVTSSTSPSIRLMREELSKRVRAVLDRLNERDREILVLRYLEQLSNREIADVLGITESSVKSRHYRALERLRDLLDDERPEMMQ